MPLETSHIRSIETSPDARLIKAEVQIGSKSHRLYFRSNDIALTGNIEALLAATLLPAMKQGGTLIAEGRVSRRFLDALHTIIDIYCSWDPSLRRVEIGGVIPMNADAPKETRVGTFFSGGVDSFYTLLKHREEITDLIYVHGFNLFFENDAIRRRISKTIHAIGSNLGKHVIEVKNNQDRFLYSYFRSDAGGLTHGAELVSVGHVLSSFFKRIFIPASHTYKDLFPWGSHPLLDPLWSTETLEFIHDGCEATRVEKVALLSKFDIALQSLQVCFFPHAQGAYNCGLCEKCQRTMVNLQAVGALERCTAFAAPLDSRRVAKLVVLKASTLAFVKENLVALKNSKDDRRLYKALRRILSRPRWQSLTMNWLRHKARQLKRLSQKHLHKS
jgi:hypothetical protein